MDATVVVRQLRELASNPQNRDTLVKDQASMQGLIYFLDNNDNSVVVSALEAMFDLSENPANRPVMKDQPYVLEGLQDTYKRQTDKRCQYLAKKILNRLTAANHSTLKDHVNQTKSGTQGMTNKHNKTYFLGNANKRAKVVTLQIKGFIDQTSRKLCEDHLLQVKGVISFTFDLCKCRFMLRVRADIKPETLVRAIAKSKTMFAEQVVKDEHGQEVLLSFGANPGTADKENDTLPQYLPEEDSPTQVADKALARVDQQQQQQSGWLSTAAKYLSQSFYW
ncbi:armadillo repeat-containing protein 1-like [Glandiceps talaboti]